MMKRTRKQQGFTLLEVMIAVGILAIALAGIMHTSISNSRNLFRFQEKTYAHWVGLNAIAEIQLAEERLAPGIRRGSEVMLNREFFWTIRIAQTETPYFFTLEVDVSDRPDGVPLTFIMAYTQGGE